MMFDGIMYQNKLIVVLTTRISVRWYLSKS